MGEEHTKTEVGKEKQLKRSVEAEVLTHSNVKKSRKKVWLSPYCMDTCTTISHLRTLRMIQANVTIWLMKNRQSILK
ncbi:hypothetical protein ANTPLA_LOCUS1719 [Anthophora plagiata]